MVRKRDVMIKLLFLLTIFTPISIAKSQLSLKFQLEVERLQSDPEGDSWKTVDKQFVAGVGGLQFHVDDAKYRLKITAFKPYDLDGTFKVRMATRADGIVAPKNTETVSIIFGPHEGCPKTEKRCLPISIMDVGNVELRLDLRKARGTSLGIFLLRPFSERINFTVRPAIKYKDKQIHCGSKVKKGFWIFASKMQSESDPINNISMCVKEPDGKVECAKDEEGSLKVRINQSGLFKFSVWNAYSETQTCEVEAT